MSSIPKVFISYSWEDENHNKWIIEFSKKLRSDGVDVTLDKWKLVPGDQIAEFMETAVRENDFILIICTPKYKNKSDKRTGGVGYEGDIMTAEVLSKSNHRKFIPILKSGEWNNVAPSWLLGKYYIDLSNNNKYENNYNDLLATLFNNREEAPEIGEPNYAALAGLPDLLIPEDEEIKEFKDVKIKGVLADEITIPRNDGTPGSALYAIPFSLNRMPESEWQDYFIESWNRPMNYTSMHRPGIAEVYGNKIILDGTTMEEVERYHRETLIQAVDMANAKMKELIAKQMAQKQREQQKKNEHLKNVRDISNRIKFDE